MEIKQTYYKVVRRDLTSAIMDNPRMKTKYSTRRYADAPVGGLLVFTDLGSARIFRMDTSGGRIFEVRVQNEVPLSRWRADLWKITLTAARKVWAKSSEHGWLSWPGQTKAFKRVKLLKEIPA